MYFKNIANLQDLKAQYRKLALQHHPDVGGNEETMKEINGEYDVLFPIWQKRHNITATEETINTETAAGTRSEFYTQNGWKGKNYKIGYNTKDIAAIIRKYVKEAYPLHKFSVTFKSYSGGSTIHIALMEAPHEVFKIGYEPKDGYIQSAEWYTKEDSVRDRSDIQLTEQAKEIIKDVIGFIKSYHYSDCDSMIDYFNVNFHYRLDIGKWDKPFKVVEKTLRIKNTTAEQKDIKPSKELSSNNKYEIVEDIDTRDNSQIYIVKVIDKLERDEYLKVAEFMKSIGGYYSKFKHGFLFKDDPTEKLTA